MKKAIFSCCLGLCVLYADSIDNALLESLEQSKKEAEERKKKEKEQAQNPQDAPQHITIHESSTTKQTGSAEENKKDTSMPNKPDTHEKTQKKNPKHSPFHKPSTQDVVLDTQDSYKKIAWFAGLGIGMQMPSDSNKKTDIMDIGLQGGFFLHLAQKHGFRFSLLANYHTFSGNSLYSLGGALDYFYHFNTQGLGLFGGIIGYAPIASNVLSTPNITARIGLSWTNDSIRLEFYGGYPFSQDARASNIVALGVGIFYVF